MEPDLIVLNQEYCLELDHKDELKPFKNEFSLPSAMIYLDGNALGAQPKHAIDLAQKIIVQEWGKNLMHNLDHARSWELPSYLGNKIAPLIGAQTSEVMIADSTALNLFKTLTAAMHIQAEKNKQRKTIIVEHDMLPTDLHVIKNYIELNQQGYQLKIVANIDELAQALSTNDVAVVVLSHVNYRSGELKDMYKVNNLIHQYGALGIWDLCHTVGALPIHLNHSKADFAVGCTYKYLNGGPGSPAFLWAHKKHARYFWDPLTAWNDKKNPQDLADYYQPTTWVRRYMSAHQPIISMRLIECGVDIFLKTDLELIRRKSLNLSDLFIQLMQQECADFGFKLITPTEHEQRGSHLSYSHPFAFEIYQALMARGIVCGYLETNTIRFGFTPLYTGFVDLWHAVQQIKAVIQNTEWQIKPFCLVEEVPIHSALEP